MANSRKSTRKPGKLQEFPAPESPVALMDEPLSPQDEPQPAVEPPTQPAKPPRTPAKPRETANGTLDPNFFQRLARIPRADWGTRVYLYLYVLEPVCNLRQSGGKSYLMRYEEPVADENRIMLEHGSGRYRFMLSQVKNSPEQGTEIARYEFEIYNPQYPPKIPKEAWVSNSLNRRWEALLPKETPAAAPGAASSMVEAMKVYGEIRRDVRDEIGEPEGAQNRTSEVLETMKAAKELFGPSTPATGTAAKDPLEIAVALYTTMSQMKADNPMIDLYRDELKAAREEMKEMRAAANAQPAAPPAKSFLEQALELASNPEKLEPLKKLAGAFGFGGGESTGRPGKTTGMDILNSLVSGPAGAQLAQGLGTLLMNVPNMLARNGSPANGQQMPHPPPVVLPAVNPGPPQPESTEQRIQRIGEQVTRQMLSEFFMKNTGGEEFAVSMYNFWPEDTRFLQALGADDLVARYRRFPQAWAVISYREPDFIQFMQEFCAWKPEEDEGPVPPGNGDDGVVDLENAEVNL